MKDLFLLEAEVDTLALEWVRLPEGAFESVSVLKHEPKEFPKLLLALLNVRRPRSVKHIAVVGFVDLPHRVKLVRNPLSVLNILRPLYLQFEPVQVEHLAQLAAVCK